MKKVKRVNEKYLNQEEFHNILRKIYFSNINYAVPIKNSKFMAKVLYDKVHENSSFPESDPRHGSGKDFAKWIFSEEPGLKENIFQTKFELMIDAKLEPNASIGLHTHNDTEEIYYILNGEVKMTSVDKDGKEYTELLKKGDAHAVLLGQGHYGKAGKKGCRFIAVAVRK